MSDQLFPYELFKTATKNFTLWEKFLLLFRPIQKSVDIQGSKSCEIFYKVLNGKIYITNLWYTDKVGVL